MATTRPKPKTSPDVQRRVRVRSRRLDEIDEAKVAVAVALMARRLLKEERTEGDRRGTSREAV